MSVPTGSDNGSDRTNSKLFTPLTIANGKIKLSHRVIMSPMTRNRGLPLTEGTPESPNRIWYPDELVAEYYAQRATEGGLLITEGIPPSVEAGAMPQVPGLFHPSQVSGWKKVVDEVHSKGGYMYAQLWHAGRVSIPQMTGCPTVSSSATPWDSDEKYPFRTPLTKEKIAYRDFPPVELSKEGIERVIGEYVQEAKVAIEEVGFDGVEVHAGNGYLPDQFLHSNINVRTDEYGGSLQNRCRFVLELVDALVEAVGESNVGIRLDPCGMMNHTYGLERVETWSYLCRELKRKHRLSYVHFIEPRLDLVAALEGGEDSAYSEEKKELFRKGWSLPKVELKIFRGIFRVEGESTPVFSAGGWDETRVWGVLEEGRYDALVFARWFLSNPDLVERLRHGRPLNAYDRSRFYGSYDGREKGYVDYPTWEQLEETKRLAN
ncbi:hypothetical protein FQN54_002844 [Arachnomyces sp. PD_36]|nr:hypothetical protein FQN54_002844 [Arachnomyces sp. PD_36]